MCVVLMAFSTIDNKCSECQQGWPIAPETMTMDTTPIAQFYGYDHKRVCGAVFASSFLSGLWFLNFLFPTYHFLLRLLISSTV
jgi:hypothetical protein